MRRTKKNVLVTLAFLAVMASGLLMPDPGRAQEQFPSKAIQFILPFAPGTGTDLSARKIGNEITRITKQPIIIDNKPGASGFLGAQAAARAPADGYTVLITTNTTHAANQSLFKKLPYSPERDFAPVALLSKIPLVLVVKQDSPVKSVKDLIQMMHAKPGKVTFASGSSSTRAGAELLRTLTNCDAVHVPYKGDPAALTDVMGGQVDFMTANLAASTALLKSGRLRPVAVTSTTRVPAFPDIPTVRETTGLGLESYEMTAWLAAFVPARTPGQIVSRLNNLFLSALKAEDVKQFFHDTGALVTPSSPEDLGQFVRTETTKWAGIVKAAGIEAE